MSHPRRRFPRNSAVLTLVVALALLGMTSVIAFAKPSKNPPGANGTVKIDGVDFDSHPDNEPHIGCVFEVDFYGFDQGAYQAEVNFQVWPPSGQFRTIDPLERDFSVFVGEDPAGGGTDLDAQMVYDLNMDVFASERHPQQGFHVKVTVLAPGADGKIAKKSKVFWLEDCIDP